MFRKNILSLLAIAGIGLGIYAAMLSGRVISPARPVSEAPQPPYSNFVAGAGIVEANTENISIGTQVAGIVSKIYRAIYLTQPCTRSCGRTSFS